MYLVKIIWSFMKICILGDCHFGCRSASSHFVKFQLNFFAKQLFPYMEKNNISQIFQLGDLWDNRTMLPLKILHKIKRPIFDEMYSRKIKFHTLVGNHDAQMKESIESNTSELLLGEYSNVSVYKTPTMVKVDKNVTFDMIPWICVENRDEVEKFIKRKNNGDFCLGHFEIAGASMYRGIQGHGGLPTDTFGRYEGVYSGHFHTRSNVEIGETGKLIQYVGTPYEITWMDAHDPRGFTVFDTETRSSEFIRTEETMFNKIYYKGSSPDISENDVHGKFIKLIVENKGDLYKFDAFLNELRSWSPYDLAIVENNIDVTGGEAGDDSIDIEDTVTIISNYIDSLETDIDKNKVKDFINGLYSEAIRT